LIRESLPSEEKPWNERWAILLRPQPALEMNGVIGKIDTEEDGEVNGVERVNEEKGGEGELKMIGVIGIVREQEIGYKLHPEFWGRGFMSEAIRAFIQLFFSLAGRSTSAVTR
jgi:RimJ/RimL family protein N-acetyltransferase